MLTKWYEIYGLSTKYTSIMSIIEKPFKILSIDGGGIKGLFSAEVLSALEEQYEGSLSNYFDLICGTSTGGLIALGLSIGIPSYELANFYKEKGKLIFPCNTKLDRSVAYFKQLLFGAKYPNRQLKEALISIFGKKKMRDAGNLLCIPSYNLSAGRPTVFKSPFFENERNRWCNDENLSMVDVALATSAAPTYFPIHDINGKYYTDGGVWANNPTLCGITEAFRHFINQEFIIGDETIKYTSLQVLSISSVNQPTGWSRKRTRNRSALLWLKGNKLLQPFMEGQSYYADFFMNCISSSFQIPVVYTRIKHEALSSEVSGNIDLDKATTTALSDLSNLGTDVAGFYRSSKADEIDVFFENYKSYKN